MAAEVTDLELAQRDWCWCEQAKDGPSYDGRTGECTRCGRHRLSCELSDADQAEARVVARDRLLRVIALRAELDLVEARTIERIAVALEAEGYRLPAKIARQAGAA